jgi:DNA polymerase-3 subunit delta
VLFAGTDSGIDTTADAEFSLTRFDGNQATFPVVLRELAMMTMFGDGQRVVVIEDADAFVTRFRGELEDYVAAPSRTSTLILLVGTFPSNTRLYKTVEASGRLVDCSPLGESGIPKWLVGWALTAHQLNCDTAAAELLVDLIGTELGLLDQELAKLALVVEKGGKLTAGIVQDNVGSWRTRTTWEMLDLALAGNVPEAIRQLDMLMQAGENPVGILAQVAYSLRRLAAATQLILDAEQQGKRSPLTTALEQAGIKRFVLQKSEMQLKRLGRHRGAKLLDWILKADLDFKGDSRIPPRMIIEQLILKIAAQQLKMPQ